MSHQSVITFAIKSIHAKINTALLPHLENCTAPLLRLNNMRRKSIKHNLGQQRDLCS